MKKSVLNKYLNEYKLVVKCGRTNKDNRAISIMNVLSRQIFFNKLNSRLDYVSSLLFRTVALSLIEYARCRDEYLKNHHKNDLNILSKELWNSISLYHVYEMTSELGSDDKLFRFLDDLALQNNDKITGMMSHYLFKIYNFAGINSHFDDLKQINDFRKTLQSVCGIALINVPFLELNTANSKVIFNSFINRYKWH